jgi:ankyrin repeat protein
MSATNALTKSVQQTAIPELRTSILGSSRRKKALTLFSRVPIPFRQVDSKHALGNFGFPALGICYLVISHLKCSPKNLKHFRLNLKCLALYQVITKNLTQKAEMSEMLKCHFRPWPLSNPGSLEKICLGFRNLVLAPVPLETIPETFQAVSRNAETLALQMNHLREFPLETIKKKSLKRFGLVPRRRKTVSKAGVKGFRARVWVTLLPFKTLAIFQIHNNYHFRLGQICSMKLNSYLFLGLISAFSVFAAEDALTQSLQKGLFEEEANHDLNAAIEIYKDVANRFDEQRKVAATALFRLGECYRKLGKTSEAQQYLQRVITEFGDQEALAAQASKLLPAKSSAVAGPGPSSSFAAYSMEKPADSYAKVISEAIQTHNMEEVLKTVDSSDSMWLFQAIHPDNYLRNDILMLAQTDVRLARLQVEFSGEHPEVVKEQEGRKLMVRGIQNRIDTLMIGESSVAGQWATRAKDQRSHLKEILNRSTSENRAAFLEILIWKMEAAYDEMGGTFERTLYQNLSGLPKDQARKTLQGAKPDSLLEQLLTMLNNEQIKAASLRADFSETHPEMQKTKAAIAKLNDLVETQVKATIEGLKLVSEHYEKAKAEYSKEIAAIRDELTRIKAGGVSVAAAPTPPTVTTQPQPGQQDSFQMRLAQIVGQRGNDEIARLEEVFRNSPDLLNARNATDKMTYLQKAAREGNLEMVNFLIQKKADLDIPLDSAFAGVESKTALHLAVENGHKAVVEALIDGGAKINAKTSLGHSPLHIAAANGFREIAVLLISKGADVNARSNQKETPLHSAMVNASTEIAQALLEKGADVNAKNSSNWTPLGRAVEQGNLELVDLLLSKGADPNIVSSTQNSILQRAVSSPNPEILQRLIKAGADLKFQDRQGMTALHLAANQPHSSYTDALKALIEGGADVNAKDFYEQTPLHLAARGDAYDTAEFLLAHGADPNVKDINSDTPLHLALKDWRLVQLLLAKGANVNAIDKKGYTPLDMMAGSGRPSSFGPRVEEILKAVGATNSAFHSSGTDPLTGQPVPQPTGRRIPRQTTIDPLTGQPVFGAKE